MKSLLWLLDCCNEYFFSKKRKYISKTEFFERIIAADIKIDVHFVDILNKKISTYLNLQKDIQYSITREETSDEDYINEGEGKIIPTIDDFAVLLYKIVSDKLDLLNKDGMSNIFYLKLNNAVELLVLEKAKKTRKLQLKIKKLNETFYGKGHKIFY